MDVKTTAYYADKEEKFQTEKPYELRFVAPDGFPSRNMTWSPYRDISVKDVRGTEHKYNARDHGFQLCKLQTSLTYEEMSATDKLEQVYMSEVASCLKENLKADRVLIFDYNIRKSLPTFPISQGEVTEYEGPATIVHVDSTRAFTKKMHTDYLDMFKELSEMGRYQYVNLWKPLKGPVTKWPLMMCDWSTCNPATDLIARDVVFPESVIETGVAFSNAWHQFYYLSEQKSDEAWIIIQTDSTHDNGVPHSAFQLPDPLSEDGERESIEVRAMVYYKYTE